MKIALAQINLSKHVSDNLGKISHYYNYALATGCGMIVFPHTALACPCTSDGLEAGTIRNKIQASLGSLAALTSGKPCVIVLGADDSFYGVRVVADGKIYDIDQSSVNSNSSNCFIYHGVTFGVCIGDDLYRATFGRSVDVILSINSKKFSGVNFDKDLLKLQSVCESHSTQIIYVNHMGGHNEFVYPGGSMALDHSGTAVSSPVYWEESISFVSLDSERKVYCNEYGPTLLYNEHSHLYSAMMVGLRDYVHKNGFEKVVIGVSGGIDSAFTAVVAADSLGPENVICVTLPSEFSSEASVADARDLFDILGTPDMNISISKAHNLLSSSLSKLFKGKLNGVVDENIQARIRGVLLMGVSNQADALLLSAGNKSEGAVGYCTLYGDTCGGYSVVKDLYKTKLYSLAMWRNSHIPNTSLLNKLNVIPNNIIKKAPTAELKHKQLDQDTLPPYEVLDKLLHSFIEEGMSIEEAILKHDVSSVVAEDVYNMIVRSGYKRKQMPLGVCLTSHPL